MHTKLPSCVAQLCSAVINGTDLRVHPPAPSTCSTSTCQVVSGSKETYRTISTQLFQSQDDDSEKVAVGSSEYYKGFMNRSLNEEPLERVTGDAILGPTFKFVGGFAAILVLLTFGFLESNGLI